MTVSMEGGNPGNPDSDPDINQTGFGYDQANGTPSAFSKGPVAIKASWKARLEQIIEALNDKGMVCILGLFYGRQSSWLDTQANYEDAMDAVTAWLIAKGYRNVIVDLANECGENPSSTWGSRAPWVTDSGVAGAIDYFKGLWAAEPWRPPVSASDRRLDFGALAGAAADVILPHANLHGGANGTGSPSTTQVNTLMSDWADKPVVVNEDSPREIGNPSLADALAADELTCTRLFDAGGSWGGFLSHHQRYHSDWADADGYPFEWRVRATEDITTGTYREKATGYTRGALNHVDGLPADCRRRPRRHP
jgi:hypothetical protein